MTPLNPEELPLDPALAALSAGSRIGAGRFTLLRLLGRGGMGLVWLARDEQLREGVALKFLPPEIRHDAAGLDDLRRETSRSRKLTHQHIIRIHDFYRSEQEAFIAMEYVDGPNLSELRLQQPDRVLKWSFLEPLVRELCEALEYAHGEHIVHRDLKPANMMLDGRGRLKLADFGIAAMVTDTVNRISAGQHRLSGTANYMSPQQLDGHTPQLTDDIYSLGATLYELLTGRAPFFTGDIPHQVRTLPPQPLEKRLAQLSLQNPVPPAVSAMIMACLAKEPEKRPPTARAVAEQIGLGTIGAMVRREASAKPEVLVTPSARPEPVQQVGGAPAAVTPPVSAASANPVPVSEKPAETHGAQRPSAATARHSSETSELPNPRRAPALIAIMAIAIIAIVAGGFWWSKQHMSSGPKTTAPAQPEFVSLFNGDFSGWEGNAQVWSVQDGALTATDGTSQEKRPVALFWRGNVEDFELRLSFRLKSGNSGIYYRARQLLEYQIGGYQFEITGKDTGLLIESGIDRDRRQPSRIGSITTAEYTNRKDKVTTVRPISSGNIDIRNLYQPGAWNDVIIIAQGNHIIHKLNGHVVVDTIDNYENRPRSGTIGFETYGPSPTTVQFRDIRLKRLTPRPGTASP